MKSTAVLLLILGLSSTAMRAASAPSQPSTPAAAKAGPVDAKAKATTKEKEKEEIPPIEGITIPRGNGTFLGLQVVNNNFVLKFFDKEKRKMTPDVSRATARWSVRYQPTDERVVLNISEDMLTSVFVVRPPHLFKITLTLLSDLPDKPVETYIVDYKE